MIVSCHLPKPVDAMYGNLLPRVCPDNLCVLNGKGWWRVTPGRRSCNKRQFHQGAGPRHSCCLTLEPASLPAVGSRTPLAGKAVALPGVWLCPLGSHLDHSAVFQTHMSAGFAQQVVELHDFQVPA